MNCEGCEEGAYVIDKLAKILAEIAVIVNGPEPPLTRWSYHDLPEKVRALKQAPPAAAVPEVEAKYAELLYAVECKWPGESRHETALRYIREREREAGTVSTAAQSAMLAAMLDANRQQP